MKVYQSQNIRNILVAGHQDSGKTSLTECLAYNTGILSRLGRVDEGNTMSDYLPEEIKKKISINTSLVAVEYNDYKFNLLDSPGFMDFSGEVVSGLRVADTLLMTIDALSGVQVSTELIWDYADEIDLSRIVFINKMDRENADFNDALDSLRDKLSLQIAPVTLPIGAGDDFKGIVDIVAMKAYEYKDGKPSEISIPSDIKDDMDIYRDMLVEAAAEGDDELTMKYLDGEEFTDAEIVRGLKAGVKGAKVALVLCGSSYKNIGVDKLAEAIIKYLPDPLEAIAILEGAENKPTAALIFKTMADPYVGKISYFKVVHGELKSDTVMYNSKKECDEKIGPLSTMQGKNQIHLPEFCTGDIGIMSKLANTQTGDTLTTKADKTKLRGIKFPIPNYTVAIAANSKADEDKLGQAISKIMEGDPTLKIQKNVETHQTLLTGMGETHIDIVVGRLQNKYGVGVHTLEAKVPYRETIKGTASKIEGRHKKQSGGHGQFGHIYIDMTPNFDSDFEFAETIFGGSVPKQYIPAVEKGIKEAMTEGILAGYPVTNIKVTLLEGSYHPVDSSEMAFKIAAHLAFRKACEVAKPVLLEPMMNVDIVVPDQFMGDIMGDMNNKRGRILGMEKEGKMQHIKSVVPLSEMYRYSVDLRSLTQGRGTFTMEFASYEELPSILADKVIAAAKDSREKA